MANITFRVINPKTRKIIVNKTVDEKEIPAKKALAAERGLKFEIVQDAVAEPADPIDMQQSMDDPIDMQQSMEIEQNIPDNTNTKTADKQYSASRSGFSGFLDGLTKNWADEIIGFGTLNDTTEEERAISRRQKEQQPGAYLGGKMLGDITSDLGIQALTALAGKRVGLSATAILPLGATLAGALGAAGESEKLSTEPKEFALDVAKGGTSGLISQLIGGGIANKVGSLGRKLLPSGISREATDRAVKEEIMRRTIKETADAEYSLGVGKVAKKLGVIKPDMEPKIPEAEQKAEFLKNLLEETIESLNSTKSVKKYLKTFAPEIISGALANTTLNNASDIYDYMKAKVTALYGARVDAAVQKGKEEVKEEVKNVAIKTVKEMLQNGTNDKNKK